MTDDNNLQHGNAVRDPQLAERAESQATVEPMEHSAEAPVEPPVGNGGVNESSPLGAFRRARLNPAVDATQAKSIPSLPPRAEGDSPPSSGPARTVLDGEETVGASAEKAPGASQESSQSDEAPPERRTAPPIEVPPPVKHLGAEIEAEIEAAMASGELEMSNAASPAAVEEAAAHQEKPPEELLEAGQHLTGRIQSIHADNVFFELGYRSPGVIPLRQFVSGKKPEVGQQLEVLVERIAHDEGLIHLNLPKGVRRIAGNWESLSKGQIVDCLVNRTNKGGLEVTVSGLRAFLPSSQVELGFISDLTPYVGQKLRVEVMEVNPRKRNLVVSRRAFLQIERQEAEEKFWQTVQVGQIFTGRVKTIKDYGAFVDLGGTDGFLHIGEMSWHRLKHPSEILTEGQTVDVKVLSLDPEKKKISLGMKQLVQNPWTTAAERFPANSTASGTVTRIADFGAFVELEPGLEGLIHVSELDHKRVRHPSDVLKVHQVVTAQVLEIDVERKRIGLSLKALLARPEEKKVEEEQPAAELPQRRRKGPLRGGTGSGAPKGLFGNPSDYV
ncbi:MAG TPA: S1 RNA-binding domain-containing protein [Planctomycetaceae bacterium]|jgi:small subunit ribosomal protein S1|nr:S1 RNA-binding domain-containing protein [Planctomycetaceae bacterium]